MNPRPWTSDHRDALLLRVTVLTACTAVVGAVGAVGIGVGMAEATQPKVTPHKATSTTSGVGAVPLPASITAASRSLTPAQVKIQVLNGTGVPGAAHAAASDLTAAGFTVVGIGNAPSAPVSTTSIVYGPGQADAAQLLGSATGVTTVSATGSGSTLVLIVGADWTGSQPVQLAPAPANAGNGGGGGRGVQAVSGGS